MKTETRTRLVLIFCLAALVTVSAVPSGPRSANCAAYMIPFCTREFEPVCGDDGQVYSNECMLCLSNAENNVDVAVAYKGEC